MNGIFGDIFDFDGDGKLDIIEQAAELAFIANTHMYFIHFILPRRWTTKRHAALRFYTI